MKSKQKNNKSARLTKNFISKHIDDRLFAEKLANGEFNSYKGLRYDYLDKAYKNADVTGDEFREILIQDFIKSAAK
ncbi:hypothetical protein, partial [uncultured Tenacibaculum sp.]|uniref:hypothetical protein n=1 Tax=uncultured Tenacibaculum sp. TaxID=174713 RepID=UPI00263A3838